MIQVKLSGRAVQDVSIIYKYIAQDNLEAADLVKARILSRIRSLAETPYQGRKRDNIRAGYRSVTEGNYVIFYHLNNIDEVRIVRILHGKRDFKKIFPPR